MARAGLIVSARACLHAWGSPMSPASRRRTASPKKATSPTTEARRALRAETAPEEQA